MHISEGVLAAPVLAGGGALAFAGLTVGLKKLEPEMIPRVAETTSRSRGGLMTPLVRRFR